MGVGNTDSLPADPGEGEGEHRRRPVRMGDVERQVAEHQATVLECDTGWVEPADRECVAPLYDHGVEPRDSDRRREVDGDGAGVHRRGVGEPEVERRVERRTATAVTGEARRRVPDPHDRDPQCAVGDNQRCARSMVVEEIDERHQHPALDLLTTAYAEHT